jgi:hypothetical protein
MLRHLVQSIIFPNDSGLKFYVGLPAYLAALGPQIPHHIFFFTVGTVSSKTLAPYLDKCISMQGGLTNTMDSSLLSLHIFNDLKLRNSKPVFGPYTKQVESV